MTLKTRMFARFKEVFAWLAIGVFVVFRMQGADELDPYARYLARTEPLSPQAQLEKFHLPAGFKIELVAAEPAVRKPINLAFDASGGLLVTGSVEYPHPAETGRVPQDEIRLLVDHDRDGTYDLSETKVFAGGLNIPIGITSVPSGVISYSIPTIDRLVDTNADGISDRRDTLVRGFGHQDTHGMASSFTPWIDGWIYACHGEGNDSSLIGADNKALRLRGGCTFRMRPDGSQLQLFTHGQANPFGMCVDRRGDVYSADSHSKPATLLLRGAWYPGVGSEHDGLGFGPAIMQHYHGSTGIAGIAYYEDDQFPEAYRESVYLGNPVTGRINHDRLTFHGSTCEATEQPDFLVCDDPWFRPVDVKVGPDGKLYIADFYDRVIGHTVVPPGHAKRDRERGRIWRISWAGMESTLPPSTRKPSDLRGAPLEELLNALAHPNLTVRTTATDQIVERIGRDAVEPLRGIVATAAIDHRARSHALWALHRLDGMDRALRTKLVNDSDSAVRLQLIKIFAEVQDWSGENRELWDLVMSKLDDEDPFVRRAAADAIGRHPLDGSPAESLANLLRLWAATPREDSMLIHTIRMAIRDVLQASGDIGSLAGPFRQRPDEMRRLAETSLGIRAPFSARFVMDHLQRRENEPRRFNEMLRHVVRYMDRETAPELFQLARSFREQDPGLQRRMFMTLFAEARKRQIVIPGDLRQWVVDEARRLLSNAEESQVHAGIELAWEAELVEMSDELLKLAGRNSPFPDLRSYAIDALTSASPQRAIGVLDELLGRADESVEIRERAAEALGRLPFETSREILMRHLTTAPAQLALAIARSLAHRREGGELLLQAITEGKASSRLVQDLVVDQALHASNLPQLNVRLEKLRAGLATEVPAVTQRIAERRDGFSSAKINVDHGKEVFEKHCAACHQVSGKGQAVGPALDAVGKHGLDRLVEDLLDPSGTVDQKYRETVVATRSGQIYVGLVIRADDEAITLVNADGKPLNIPLSQIESRRQTTLSSMPQNVAERLSEPDFYDLVGYLLSLRS